MEKLVYLLWGDAAAGSDHYRDLLVDTVAPELRDRGVAQLTIDVDDAASDVASPVPTPSGEQPHVAAVSVWLPANDRRGPVEEVLPPPGSGPPGTWCRVLCTPTTATTSGAPSARGVPGSDRRRC